MAETPDHEIVFHQRHVHDPEELLRQDDRGDETFEDVHDREGGGDVLVTQGVRMSKAGLPVKPDTYDGTGDWEEYLSHFELCSELGRWQEQEKTLALAASLRGPARTFYISLPSRDKRSYQDLIHQLGNRFGSTRQRSRWLSRLESRTRQTGESIAALGDDLRQMSQKAYPNLDCVAQEALAVNQLYKSISLEMKCRCIDRNCTTIAQAVDIIERYEAVLGETGGDKRKAARMVASKNSEDDDLKKTLLQISDRLETLETQMSNNGTIQRGNAPWNPGNITCFICNSPEHFMKDCPQNRNGRQGQTTRYGQRSRSSNQGNFKPTSH